MQVSGYNIKKALSNLMGRLTGYESCVFCGDRGNWKPMMGNVCVSAKDKKIEYELPMCEECFASQPLNAVLHAINAGISEYNNFCRSLKASPAYSDADQELIMSAVCALKIGYEE